jgi:predicted RNase H-like HicB family nuclease
MKLSIESELEDDGRWLAEVPELPGVLAYGESRDEALAKAQVLALRVLAERLEHREGRPEAISISIRQPKRETFSARWSVLGGRSNVSRARIRLWSVTVGQMSFSPFTTAMKLVPRCSPGCQSTQA